MAENRPSRLISNSVQLPNAIVDELMAQMTEAQLKCYLLVLRKTVGWHKERDGISISQFLKFSGIKKRQTVNAALRFLMHAGLVESVQVPGKPTLYSIALPDQVSIPTQSAEQTPSVERTPSAKGTPSAQSTPPTERTTTPSVEGTGTPSVERTPQNPLPKPTTKTQGQAGRSGVDPGPVDPEAGESNWLTGQPPDPEDPGSIQMTPDWWPLPLHGFKVLCWDDETFAVEVEAYRSSILGRNGSSHDRRTPAQWSYNFLRTCLKSKRYQEAKNGNETNRKPNQAIDFNDDSWADSDIVADALGVRS